MDVINEVTIAELRKSMTKREVALMISIFINNINIITSIAGSPTDLGTMSLIVLSVLLVFGDTLLLADFFQYRSSRLSPFGQSGLMFVEVSLVSALAALIQISIELSKCLDVPIDIINLYRDCQETAGSNCILLSKTKLVGVGNQICGNVTSDSYVTLQGFRLFFIISSALLNIFVVHKTWNLQKVLFKLPSSSALSMKEPREMSVKSGKVVSEVLVFRTTIILGVFDVVKLCIVGTSDFVSLPISSLITFAGLGCIFTTIFQCNFFKPVDVKDAAQQTFLSTGIRIFSFIFSVEVIILTIIAYIYTFIELSHCSNVSVSKAQLVNCQNSQLFSDFACMTQIQSSIVSPATGLCYNIALEPVIGPLWITVIFFVNTMFFVTGCATLEKSEGWQLVTHIFNSYFV